MTDKEYIKGLMDGQLISVAQEFSHTPNKKRWNLLLYKELQRRRLVRKSGIKAVRGRS
jgi:hypothetical protein